MNVSPPGGLPYHPKELGVDTHSDKNITIKTGLIGVFLMVGMMYWSLIVLIVSSPLLVLGLVEVVAAGPTNYRVRWIRRDLS